jgi:hypothetical protein
MATKKITLNELRTLVKQIIKEESGKINLKEEFKVREKNGVHLITNFNLNLGNNYTSQHFADALNEEQPDIIEYLSSINLSDSVIFKYNGKYGKHEDKWSVYDLWDYLK